MAQAIVCYNHEGLVLASDSLLLQELEGSQVERLTRRTLFALGSRAAILTTGPAGVALGEGLSQWLAARHLVDFDDVMAVSRDFLAEGYARYLRGDHAGPNALAAPRHLYFLIGGYCTGSAAGPCRLVLLESAAGELPFKEVALGRVFAVPRRVALEGRITRQIAEGASLRELAASCRAGLADIARRNPEAVDSPFQVAMVTPAGIQTLDEAPAASEDAAAEADP